MAKEQKTNAMRFLEKSGGVWQLSDKTDMPTLTAAVQHFDRLYGICSDTLYVSEKGNFGGFEIPETEDKNGVTADKNSVNRGQKQ